MKVKITMQPNYEQRYDILSLIVKYCMETAHVQIYNRIIAPKMFGELISDIGTGLIANVEKRMIKKK